MIGVVWGTPEGVEALNQGEALQLAVRQATQRPVPPYQQDRQLERVFPVEHKVDTAWLGQQQAQMQPVRLPPGYRIAELLERVRVELMAQNAELAASAGQQFDPAEMRQAMTRTTARELNERLIALVMQAIYIQQDVQAELKKLGLDPSSPRI